VRENSSRLIVGEVESEGPSYFFGSVSYSPETGRPSPPSVPPRATMRLKRVKPLHNREGRYFIPASGRLQIVSLERPEKYRLEEDLKSWRSILSSGDPVGPRTRKLLEDQLGEIPWMNAAQAFHGKLRYRKFSWGRAVLFLTTYVQGITSETIDNDGLILIVQGLTDDGRYAVNGHLEIRHPGLPDSLHFSASPTRRSPLYRQEGWDRAEKWLDAQPDESFEPTIGQYEKFLEALEISPGPLAPPVKLDDVH